MLGCIVGAGTMAIKICSSCPMKVRPRAATNASMNSRPKVSFRINTIHALAPAGYRQEDNAVQPSCYLSAAPILKNLSAGSLANSDKAVCVSGVEGCFARSVVVVVVRLVVPLGDGPAARNP